MKLHDKVYNYPTESEYGFTKWEMQELLTEYPEITEDMFNEKLGVNTCMMNDRGEIITYHIDVLRALTCCIEGREASSLEWD